MSQNNLAAAISSLKKKNLKQYEATFNYVKESIVLVEAENEEEAEQLARHAYDAGNYTTIKESSGLMRVTLQT